MLHERASELRERMDAPDCDQELLSNTYAQFATVNRLLSGWGRAFRLHLAPRLTAGSTLLDVGCGGGDLARRIARWGISRGEPLHVTAIDPDPRALAFATSQPPVEGVEYRSCSAQELAERGDSFDCVISNHVLHHLDDEEVSDFLEVSASLTRRVALHNDLRREPVAWFAFALTRPLFRRSFIVDDGLRSIRRSFTPAELEELLPSGWRLERLAPFRQLVLLER